MKFPTLVIASVIHGETLVGVKEHAPDALLVYLFGVPIVDLVSPEMTVDAQRILASVFPQLAEFRGVTFDERLLWQQQRVTMLGDTLKVEPFGKVWFYPSQFPSEAQCKRIIQWFKERRFALEKNYQHSNTNANMNLVRGIRQAMQEP